MTMNVLWPGLICYGVGIALLAKSEDKVTRVIGLLSIVFGALLLINA